VLTLEDVATRTREGLRAILKAYPWHEDLLARLSREGRVGLAGGAVRDFVLGAKPRDLDYAVDAAEAAQLEWAIGDAAHASTRFGGCRVKLHDGSPDVDVWMLKNTWGFAQPSSPSASWENLPKTFPHSISAVVVMLDTFEVHEHGFLESLRTHTVDLGFEPNAKPLACLLKGLTLAHRFGYDLAPNFVAYALRLAAQGLSEEVFLAEQRRAYGDVRLPARFVAEWIPGFSFTP
jgi:hypothetical protein